jgi:hypothetical protein
VPTSKRPQINNAQYPRIPIKVLKGASNEEITDDVVAVVGSRLMMKLAKEY